ncbi:MAG TPA: FAD-containing oxidoreductase [Burkholderiaceae bacterium]|jgi:pyruvate/2-oxoglutarate dehydrogenase complex dihydrolipoamide dehydrogenase (E3) component|nr:FAD-containing oxidoreductase [Burkholderiaceae bacterium]
MAQRFDAIIIGSGQAGPPLAGRLTGAGMTVAFVEREHFGGTCVNDGCTPTKTLVASAQAAFVARRHADFGVTIGGPVGVDMRAVKARKDAIVKASVDGLAGWVGNMPGLRVIWGHARFTAPHRIVVNGEQLEADRIFINVGGRPTVPDWPALSSVPYLTNTTMMNVDFVPEHLVVIGGSYVGLEFAQMYRRFGARVTVIEQRPRLIAREDEDVSEAVQDILAREGIAFRLNARCIGARPGDGGIVASADCEEGEPEIAGSHLLVAVGRRPNTDDLGLGAAGIECDERGFIKVDDQLRTNVPGVWALGDVNGRGAFTHTSWNDYEIVAANLLDSDPRRVTDRIDAYALFIDPPLGRAGITESEARAQGRAALVGRMPMTRVGRARERSETLGFMKVIVDAQSRTILGAALLGLNGDEVVHSILDVMYAKAPCTVISRAVHIHPTVAELIPTLLQTLTPLQVIQS